MDMFGDNTDIEGVDVKNACFGGTQALFHAIDWIYANWATEGTINFLLPVLIFKTSLIDDIPMFLSLNSILNNKVHEECIRLHHVNRLVFYIWFLKIILTFCISFFLQNANSSQEFQKDMQLWLWVISQFTKQGQRGALEVKVGIENKNESIIKIKFVEIIRNKLL